MPVWLSVILALGVVVLLALGVGTYLSVSDAKGNDEDRSSCAIDTTITMNTVDALSKGTTLSPTSYAKVNDGNPLNFTSTTTFSPGDKIAIILELSDYIDVTVPTQTLKCGENIIEAEMYASDDQAFRIFNSDGNLLTDSASGGATNQTGKSTPITFSVRIDGNTDESSGDLLIVVEASNTTACDDINFAGNGATRASVPDLYSENGASALSKAFNVPAHVDGESKEYSLVLSPETSKNLASMAVYVTAYSKQPYRDTDGSFVASGVEDTDGNTKYEDDWDHDFWIQTT